MVVIACLNGNLGEGTSRGCRWTRAMCSAALGLAAEDVGNDDSNNDYDDVSQRH